MSSDFLLTAMASFPKIEDPAARAAAFVTAAGILYADEDASWAAQALRMKAYIAACRNVL